VGGLFLSHTAGETALADKPERQLRVMVVDMSAGRAAILEQALRDQGCDVIARLSGNEDLVAQVARHSPDVILIDMDMPDRDTLESMRTLTRELPRPIVMFAEHSDSRTIEEAVQAGVSAYIVDGLSAQRLKPIMEVAIARFREFQALREELEFTKSKLADRKDVDRAKGILMREKSMSEDDAYGALRRMAMDRNQKIGEVARMLIAAADLLR